jgi:hypothetical protein
VVLSLYVTLGIFLLMVVRDPSANRNLIAFAAWSGLAHSALMGIQAFRNLVARGAQNRERILAARILMVLSASILFTLGVVHLVYTFWGTKLTPRDPVLQISMSQISPVITKETTMCGAVVNMRCRSLRIAGTLLRLLCENSQSLLLKFRATLMQALA